MRDMRQSQWRPAQLPLVCMLLLIAVIFEAVAGESPGQVSPAAIAQSVTSSLPKSQGRSATVVTNLDLTRPFETRTQWAFVAATLPGSHPGAADGEPIDGGALAECFVNDLTPHCKYATPPTGRGRDPSSYDAMSFWFSTPVEFYSAEVVFAGADNTRPLLLITAGSASGVNGGHSIYTELFDYDRRSNEFQSVFSNATSSNNNQKTRFMEAGPLRGDVIVDEPSGSYYFIEVYRQGVSGSYDSILGYRGRTVYGDGNRLSVSDSEMPEILRRLGLWHRGDALPVPHEGCTPVMRRGEEWCK